MFIEIVHGCAYTVFNRSIVLALQVIASTLIMLLPVRTLCVRFSKFLS